MKLYFSLFRQTADRSKLSTPEIPFIYLRNFPFRVGSRVSRTMEAMCLDTINYCFGLETITEVSVIHQADLYDDGINQIVNLNGVSSSISTSWLIHERDIKKL